MKHILTILLLGGLAFAQSKTATKTGTASKAAPAAAHAPAVYRVKLTTTKGDVVVEITRAWAPLGADRFYQLVRSGFFTGAPFFRVIPNFMCQFGISPTPAVNKTWEARRLPDDPKPYQSNKRGTLTFATTGQPNSRGTQLFINYKDNTFLDSQGFAPIGQVVEGMEIAEQFYSGYGDTASKEGEIENGGQAYLDRNMPHVDKIIRATIVPAPPKPAAEAKQ
ncbi:MAG TPA: peptidylprolyl isomerase [Bryobacteraceae bacterium]|jgi:peptidyl-prolyl cis-trans isomerase A (cyclophilin A)|nr:peptidylprolyl isomerase [Bryobacteraceae bacterium]